MTDSVLLSLVVAPLAHDTVVDLLLENTQIDVFSSHHINAHGIAEHTMSIAEQVTGSQGQIMFQVFMPSEGLSGLLNTLKTSCQGAGMRYWVTPVTESGII